MILLISLFTLVTAHAAQSIEPIYRDLNAHELEWKSCYQNNAGPAFEACIDRVASKAESWKRVQFSSIRSSTAKLPDPKLKLKAFDRIQNHYQQFHSNQCEFEAHTRSDDAKVQLLQRTRCRFRLAFDGVIHMYDALRLFGEGAKTYDDSFVGTPRVRPEFKSAIEGEMYDIRSNQRPCFAAAGTESDKRLLCMKAAAKSMNEYLEKRLNLWLEPLRKGPRGEMRYYYLQETQKYWSLYRKDFCNFVAEYSTGYGDPNDGAISGNKCVYNSTVARIREMYQLR